MLLSREALADNGEMGLAIVGEGRLYDQDAGARARGVGFGVYQHTHFGSMAGADVGLVFSHGVDGHDHTRTDLGFLMPGISLRIPTKGDWQPYFSTGFVMTCSFFATDFGGVMPFMYAGNRSAVGVEWRTDKDQSWFIELATTVRGRFTVEQNDKPIMASHPDFARDTRVVHELSLAIGTSMFFK
ncbi:MAG: hypothetical protein ACXVEF_36545 [Polyangiales bacterium]